MGRLLDVIEAHNAQIAADIAPDLGAARNHPERDLIVEADRAIHLRMVVRQLVRRLPAEDAARAAGQNMGLEPGISIALR